MVLVEVPETRYAKTNDAVHVAYQVVGDGPPDVVYANSYMSHIEVSWEYPPAARFYDQMSRFGRLVLFDRRGTGLSDPIVGRFSMEDRVNDLLAVLDAVGLERAVLLGSSEGGAACAYFAALYPERVSALVLFSPLMVAVVDEECPWAWTREIWELFFDGLDEAWASGGGVEFTNPSLADDAQARAWYARYFRLSASPSLVRALMRYNLDVEIRSLLPTIQVPTLLLHRTDETWLTVEQRGSYMSSARVLTAVGEDLEDLAGDVALQASHDFAGAESFSAAACDVDAGAFVAAHPDEDDPPERVVGLTVSTAVEAMPPHLPG